LASCHSAIDARHFGEGQDIARLFEAQTGLFGLTQLSAQLAAFAALGAKAHGVQHRFGADADHLPPCLTGGRGDGGGAFVQTGTQVAGLGFLLQQRQVGLATATDGIEQTHQNLIGFQHGHIAQVTAHHITAVLIDDRGFRTRTVRAQVAIRGGVQLFLHIPRREQQNQTGNQRGHGEIDQAEGHDADHQIHVRRAGEQGQKGQLKRADTARRARQQRRAKGDQIGMEDQVPADVGGIGDQQVEGGTGRNRIQQRPAQNGPHGGQRGQTEAQAADADLRVEEGNGQQRTGQNQTQQADPVESRIEGRKQEAARDQKRQRGQEGQGDKRGQLYRDHRRQARDQAPARKRPCDDPKSDRLGKGDGAHAGPATGGIGDTGSKVAVSNSVISTNGPDRHGGCDKRPGPMHPGMLGSSIPEATQIHIPQSLMKHPQTECCNSEGGRDAHKTGGSAHLLRG
jgi:hypothetical protein